ncbi:MAG: protein kinase [Deltaproteobacteria bacterium]|nr:protein kinase [Deltaproteobacteria bacterium]
MSAVSKEEQNQTETEAQTQDPAQTDEGRVSETDVRPSIIAKSERPSFSFEPEPKIGEGFIIDERYQVEKCLGSGAMGSVYLVNHLRLNKLFALKMVKREFAKNEEFVARFKREANACSLLDHPNCISVTDFGQTKKGELYLVMDFVDGVPLRDLLENGPLPLPEAIEYTRQILIGLEHAHGKSLIHRDIKLENIFKGKRDNGEVVIKIMDFGMAKSPHSGESPQKEDLSITRKGIVLGTPQYMSPEQLQNHPVDEKSDLYSVGVTLFRLISGEVVFKGNTLLDLFNAKLKERAPTLKESTGKKYPAALEAFLEKALKIDPDERFSSATQMLEELTAIADEINNPKSPIARLTKTQLAAAGIFIVLLSAITIYLFFISSSNSSRHTNIKQADASAPKQQFRVSDNNPASSQGVKLPIKKQENIQNFKLSDVASSTENSTLLTATLLIDQKKCTKALSLLNGFNKTQSDENTTSFYLLGKTYVCLGQFKKAISFYKKAIDQNPQYQSDGLILEQVKKMVLVDNIRPLALNFMIDTLKDSAIPVLIQYAGHHQNKDIRHTAITGLKKLNAMEHVNIAASLDWDLNQAVSCNEKKEIIKKLVALNSAKARQVLIRARDIKIKTGLFKKEYKHNCVRRDIINAISLLPEK